MRRWLAILIIVSGCGHRKQVRWPASPAMTFGSQWQCADVFGANGYGRIWQARPDGYCYEDDAPKYAPSEH